MERVMSDEEKIRRAIEISKRRNQGYYTTQTTRVNVNDKKDYKLFKRMILQIIICLLIYLIFYLISTTNYIFSDSIIKTTTSILNYDINLEKLYKDCENFLTTTINNNTTNEQNTEGNEEQNDLIENVINNTVNEAQENTTNANKVENNVTENITQDKNETTEGNKTAKTVMEQDAETVKKLCKFQKPLNGTITSGFGEREVTSKVMSANHKGIDIAAKSGTSIKAAIEGTVSVASQNSEYGKFIKIVNGDVMTVYAHCKALKVKEGDKVKKGATIATVGTTGNSTGPHLHFEIRLSNRYIDPKLVINF